MHAALEPLASVLLDFGARLARWDGVGLVPSPAMGDLLFAPLGVKPHEHEPALRWSRRHADVMEQEARAYRERRPDGDPM